MRPTWITAIFGLTAARNSAELYYPHSQSSKIRQYQENKARVIEELEKSYTPLTARDLAEIFGLDDETIRFYLTPNLKDSDSITMMVGKRAVQIKREVQKGVVYYQVENDQNGS